MSWSCNCSEIYTWWGIALIVCATVALLSIDRVEYWRYGEETPQRMAVFLLITRIALIEVVAQIDYFHLSPFLYLIPPFLASLYFGNRVGNWLAGLGWMAYIVQHILHAGFSFITKASEIRYLSVFTIGLIFVMTMARMVATEKAIRARTEQLLADLEASHQQLRVYSEQVADLAATRERNRLARDIHDTLGHYLTVINVQLEKALAFRARKPTEADRAVGDAKRLANEALQDVRRSVGALRKTEEMFAFWPSMNELIEQVRSDQRVVTLHIEGHEDSFSKQRLLILFRVAQEGMTNIRKHTQADSVQLDIIFGEQEAHLSLSDDGCGFDPTILQQMVSGRDGGYGLQGIQERLEIIGGTFSIESAPGKGTTLQVMVPSDNYVAV
jgi:signal transduction histidine kinase